MSIGKTLSELIDKRQMNVNLLSELCGVPASTIYSIIRRDNMKVDITTLGKICQVLEVPMEYFYDEYVKKKISSDFIPHDDKERLRKFHALDSDGQNLIDIVLNHEYNRCTNVTITTTKQCDDSRPQYIKMAMVSRSLNDENKPEIVEENINDFINAPDNDIDM